MTSTKPGLFAAIATMSEDMQQNLSAAEQLVNTIAAQRDEVKRAYERGWRECAEALSYVGVDMWTGGYAAGRADEENETNARWAEVARRAHYLGSTMSRTYAEKREAELAACQPRDADFRGTEQDPECLDRCRASVESIARSRQQRAAA